MVLYSAAPLKTSYCAVIVTGYKPVLLLFGKLFLGFLIMLLFLENAIPVSLDVPALVTTHMEFISVEWLETVTGIDPIVAAGPKRSAIDTSSVDIFCPNVILDIFEGKAFF